jgi:hypothetical protein
MVRLWAAKNKTASNRKTVLHAVTQRRKNDCSRPQIEERLPVAKTHEQ